MRGEGRTCFQLAHALGPARAVGKPESVLVPDGIFFEVPSRRMQGLRVSDLLSIGSGPVLDDASPLPDQQAGVLTLS